VAFWECIVHCYEQGCHNGEGRIAGQAVIAIDVDTEYQRADRNSGRPVRHLRRDRPVRRQVRAMFALN
jgi:hypothetical protein